MEREREKGLIEGMRRDRKWGEKVMIINGYQEILARWKFGTNKKEAEREREEWGERVWERERG